MSIDTLESLDLTLTTQPAEPGDHDLFAHYVKKEDIIASTIDGTPAIALCGKKWQASRSPEGLTVCPECQDVHACNACMVNKGQPRCEAHEGSGLA